MNIKRIFQIFERIGVVVRSIGGGTTKIRFKCPEQCDVFIIDSAAKFELGPPLLKGYRWFALDYRFKQYGGELFVHPVIAFRTLFNFGETRSLLKSYMLAMITVTKPKIVIDFCSLDYMMDLARLRSDITFISIVNGLFNYPLNHELYSPMLHQILGKKPVLTASNYSVFCFGQRDADIFEYFGASQATNNILVKPVGPLLGSYYLETIEPGFVAHEYDICLVSQAAVGHITNANGTEFNKLLMKCNDLLSEFLVRFIEERGLRLVVAPRTREQWADERIEHEYFRSWFGPDVHIAQREDLMSTYRVMRRSRVVISLCSTCGWEALLWKQKTMHCPFHLSEVFGEYAPGKCTSNQDMWHWWLENPKYEEFEQMLLGLLNMTEDQYWTLAERQAYYGMNYGDRLATHIIGDAIAAAVGGRVA
jgi:hypothetical protein